MAFIGVLFYFIQKKYRHSSREIKRLDAVNYSTLLTHISETSKFLYYKKKVKINVKLIVGSKLSELIKNKISSLEL